MLAFFNKNMKKSGTGLKFFDPEETGCHCVCEENHNDLELDNFFVSLFGHWSLPRDIKQILIRFIVRLFMSVTQRLECFYTYSNIDF